MPLNGEYEPSLANRFAGGPAWGPGLGGGPWSAAGCAGRIRVV